MCCFVVMLCRCSYNQRRLKSLNQHESITIFPIGYVSSPYGEKFAVPRQPGLAPNARSFIHFYPPYSAPLAFEGLEGFSHIHVIFLFDRVEYKGFKATVRPPRLGGNKRIGVFASRSPFRPSRLGLSVIKLEQVISREGTVILEVSGADLVDGTPVIDIKPYIPFVDAVPNAEGGFAPEPPNLHEVSFSAQALQDLGALNEKELIAIKETLAQDPRPAYKGDHEEKRIYGALLYGFDVHFVASQSGIKVINAKRT